MNGIARLLHCFGDELKDNLFIEKLGRISIKELSRTARDRRAGSLGFSEAMLITYNKKAQRPLQFTKLYSNKGFKVQDAISKEEADALISGSDDIDDNQIDLFNYDEDSAFVE